MADNVKRLTDRGMKQCNIHFCIYEESFKEACIILDMIKNDVRLEKLQAIVFLALKKTGRERYGNYNPLSQDKFNYLVKYCLDNHIGFGCDSCNYYKFEKAVKSLEISETDKNYFLCMADPCESGCMSAYISVDGKYFPCSFCEKQTYWENQGIDVLSCNDFIKEVWNSDRALGFRKKLLENGRQCPYYTI
jgi:hypothetical protein